MTISGIQNPQLSDGPGLALAVQSENQHGFVSGLTATGTNQATGLQLSQLAPLVEVNTVAAGTGVLLPPAIPGAEMFIFNNGANTLTVYGHLAADTILNVTTGAAILVQTGVAFWCGRDTPAQAVTSDG